MDRRLEDRPIRILALRAAPSGADGTAPGTDAYADPEWLDRLAGGVGHAVVETGIGPEGACDFEHVVFIDEAAPRAILASAGSPAAHVSASSALGLAERSARELQLRHAARVRALVRLSAMERMILLAEQLARAVTAEEIAQAVADHVPAVLGGGSALLVALDAGTLASMVHGTDADAPVLLHAAAVPAASGIPEPLRGMLSGHPEWRFACAPLGSHGFLAVVERRAERRFEPEDWFRLRSMARQTEAALERIALRAALAGHAGPAHPDASAPA